MKVISSLFGIRACGQIGNWFEIEIQVIPKSANYQITDQGMTTYSPTKAIPTRVCGQIGNWF